MDGRDKPGHDGGRHSNDPSWVTREYDTEIRVLNIGPRGRVYEYEARHETYGCRDAFRRRACADRESRFRCIEEALDVAAYDRAKAADTGETLTAEDVTKALEAPTPLAFWRAKRRVKQKDLAAQVAAVGTGIGLRWMSEQATASCLRPFSC